MGITLRPANSSILGAGQLAATATGSVCCNHGSTLTMARPYIQASGAQHARHTSPSRRTLSTHSMSPHFSAPRSLSTSSFSSTSSPILRAVLTHNARQQYQQPQQQRRHTQAQQIRSVTMLPKSQLKTTAEQDTSRRTPTLFNPIYTEEELRSVKVLDMQPVKLGDKVAFGMVKLARWGFDFVTRYKHPERFPRVKGWEDKRVKKPLYDPRQPSRPSASALSAAADIATKADEAAVSAISPAASTPHSATVSAGATPAVAEAEAAGAKKDGLPEEMTLEEMRKQGLCMTPEQWMVRLIFLESIAGVPGFVGSMIRHLQSLRLMRRDKGWIHTLLEDAENERMHLLTCMQVAQPGWFLRLMVVGAQAVFCPLYSIAYFIWPSASHSFVSGLEFEAVRTYSNVILDIEQGRLPEWESMPAPQIAKDYWKMAPDATWYDVMLAIRADEATHRFLHSTLAVLDQKNDFNPFAVTLPSATVRGSQPGFSSEEARLYAAKAAEEADKVNHEGPHMATLSRNIKHVSEQQQQQQKA